jgi:hypothetical protein
MPCASTRREGPDLFLEIETQETNTEQDAFLKYINIASIVTDAALVALPMAIIYPLHMTLRLRLTVISFFLFRIMSVPVKVSFLQQEKNSNISCVASVIAATVLQLVYVGRLFEDNFTFRAFPYYISMQLVLFVSILAACVVYFWPFLRSLRSGLMSANATTLTSQYPLTRPSKGTFRNKESNLSPSAIRKKRGYLEITRSRTPMEQSTTGTGT